MTINDNPLIQKHQTIRRAKLFFVEVICIATIFGSSANPQSEGSSPKEIALLPDWDFAAPCSDGFG